MPAVPLVPAHPGAARLAAACAVAWLGFAVIGLAVVLEAAASTGSFARAGVVAAAYAIGSSIAAVPRGGLVDRRGARRALPPLALVHVSALLALVAAAPVHSTLLLAALAAAAGAASPPLIGASRGAWATTVPAEELPRAYALTALIGDVALVGGPPFASAIAATAAPAGAVLVSAGAVALGTRLVLGSPLPPPAHLGARRGALRSPGMRTIASGGVLVGVGLGSLDVSLPAVAHARGHLALAGVLLGAMAAGTMCGSLLSPRAATRLCAARRYRWGLAGMGVAGLPLTVAPATPVLILLLALAGCGWGLANVSLYELLDRVTLAGRANEAWAWLSMAEGVGIAAGAALAGAAVQTSASLALALVPAAATCAAIRAAIGRRALGG